MDALFVAKKPIFMSSNQFIMQLKRKLQIKKIGFSGTLDPFATGTLIIATGKYTKLFQYLNKTPKVYRATLWLGAQSKSLDIENITSIQDTPKISTKQITKTLHSLIGKISYEPPLFSAKKIDGKRAYEIARKNQNITLKKITSTIYDIKLIHYTHPFITFEISLSEGAYVRSIAQLIAKKLNVDATLSALERVKEGLFEAPYYTLLNPFKYLKIKENFYQGDFANIHLGKKLLMNDFTIDKDGIYFVQTPKQAAIIEITNQKVHYKINNIPLFKENKCKKILMPK